MTDRITHETPYFQVIEDGIERLDHLVRTKVQKLVEKAKLAWAQPGTRERASDLLKGSTVLLGAAFIASLVLHFGFRMVDLKYAGMFGAWALMAVIKSSQFKDEAKILRIQKQNHEHKETADQLQSRIEELRAFRERLKAKRVTAAEMEEMQHALPEHKIEEVTAEALATLAKGVRALETDSAMLQFNNTRKEMGLKILALLGGLALVGIFAYQLHGLLAKHTMIRVTPSLLVSSIALVSYGVSMIQICLTSNTKKMKDEEQRHALMVEQGTKQLILEQARTRQLLLGSTDEAVGGQEIEQGGEVIALKQRRLRHLPNTLSKVSLGLGVAILVGAIALSVLRYYGITHIKVASSLTELNNSTLISLAVTGGIITVSSLIRIATGRSKEDIEKAEQERADLRAEIERTERQLTNLHTSDGLTALMRNLDESREAHARFHKRYTKVQTVVGGLIIFAGAGLIVLQMLGLHRSLFTKLFHAKIATDLVSVTSATSYGISIIFVGIQTTANAADRREEVEKARLEAKRDTARLRLRHEELVRDSKTR